MGGIAHRGQATGLRGEPPPDPRGLFRGLVFGLALLLFAWPMARSGSIPTPPTRLTALSGVLLVVIYMGRLMQ